MKMLIRSMKKGNQIDKNSNQIDENGN
jgi:hypothetical protein